MYALRRLVCRCWEREDIIKTYIIRTRLKETTGRDVRLNRKSICVHNNSWLSHIKYDKWVPFKLPEAFHSKPDPLLSSVIHIRWYWFRNQHSWFQSVSCFSDRCILPISHTQLIILVNIAIEIVLNLLEDAGYKHCREEDGSVHFKQRLNRCSIFSHEQLSFLQVMMKVYTTRKIVPLNR